MQEIKTSIAAVCAELFDQEVDVVLTRPDTQFGDYATNVAMQLAKPLGKNPREIAESIAAKIRENSSDVIDDISVAGPGFLNITLTDTALIASLQSDISQLSPYKRVLLEYSCPNAFKELHTGHLYQTVVGDSMGRLLEATGAKVYRANFGGDVGLHVAKCLYGIIQKLDGEHPEKLAQITDTERPEWISSAYVAGSGAYESDESAKQRITELNTQVYAIHNEEDHQSNLAQLYWTCRGWSYDYFKAFYEEIRVEPFDKYYPESTTATPGMSLIEQNKGTVFADSDGAVVFDGEAVGLHTRVFITSKGLPTYETKDLGVIAEEAADFSYDKRMIMTGNDQSEYMKVVFAALAAFNPELAAKQTHLTHGTVRFGTGQKMSSRLGNVTRAADVIQTVSQTVADTNPATDHYTTALAAIKYSFLKHRLGGDIAFDINESVSLEGNSGPYLQYAHARARSILAKTTVQPASLTDLEPGERLLAQKLSEYTEVVQRSATELLPHHICTYLYELSQEFNRFYEKNRVISDPRETQRLQLVTLYANTLKQGLSLLGIHAPNQM